MIGKLRNFISKYNRIYVYNTGMESLRIMKGLIDEGLLNTAFLVEDDFYNSMESVSILGRKLFSCSHILTQKDKSNIGILVSSLDNVTLSEVSKKTGIKIGDIFRDTRREVPERFFRYISPKAFNKLIKSKVFTFVSPSSWDDKYEGYLYHALQTEEGRKIIEKYAMKCGAEEGEIRDKLQYVYDNTRCVCVSGSEDSVVMWNAYDFQNKAIMIEISKAALKDERIMVCPVEYVEDNISLSDEMQKVMNENGIIIHKVYTTKRRCFAYEDETRLFYRTEHPKPNVDARIDIVPSEFIVNVMVHPKATECFVRKIEKVCLENGIKFSGRSQTLEYR